MKKKTSITKDQYQGLYKVYEFDKKEGNDEKKKNDDKTPTIKKYNISNSKHPTVSNSKHFANAIIFENLIAFLLSL